MDFTPPADYTKETKDATVAQYESAFVQTFGIPGENQDWGFGSSSNGARAFTRANSENYPATSGNINANANQWAYAGTGITQYGGWQVPDKLTDGQKLRVRAYFQANPNLSYQDPHWRHFFVQQVYKGGTGIASTAPTKENIIAANGSTATNGTVSNSDKMDKLTVSQSNIHINNFNAGNYNYGGTVKVLDNGADINQGPWHYDQIMLMVNVDDTSCFGYWNSSSSHQENGKAALVSAETIDAWALTKKDSLENIGCFGEDVVDDWHRSFMGFDLALREGENAYAKNGNTVINATYAQAPESPNVAWDGTQVITLSDKTIKKADGTAIPFLDANENFYAAAAKVVLNQSQNVSGPENANNVNAVIMKEFWYNGQKYQSVVNLPRLQELIADGYLPVKDKSLQNWVKLGKSDGYFSDWIVTLTEAKRIGEKYDERPVYVKRVMAEDLSATEGSDFDFNDVVFDVAWTSTGAKIKLQAAGGTLPLYIGDTAPAHEVHAIFAAANPTLGITTADMINTRAQNGDPRMSFHKAFNNLAPVEFDLTGDFTENGENNANKIKIYVVKDGKTLELTAVKAQPASKFGCPITVDWADEFQNIDDKWPVKKFTNWVQGGANFWE